MFAMAAARFEGAAFYLTPKLPLRNALQNICASHLDALDRLMQRGRVKISLERFDVGQLWHRGFILIARCIPLARRHCCVWCLLRRTEVLRSAFWHPVPVSQLRQGDRRA